MKTDTVEDYLKQTCAGFRELGTKCNMYEFVLKHGRSWKPIPKMPKEFRVHKGKQGDCFRNASLAALSDRCLTYVEGYASSIIPVMHAWCVTARGEVVEVTWKKPGDSYYGIPFQRKFLMRQLINQKTYGLIDQWENKWQLVRGEFPVEEWLKQ